MARRILAHHAPSRAARRARETGALAAVLVCLTACGATSPSWVASTPTATSTPTGTATAAGTVSATATSTATQTPSGAPTVGADETYAVFPQGVPVQGWTISAAARRGDPDSADLLADAPDIEWSAEYDDQSHEFGLGPHIKIAGYKRALAEMISSASAVKVVGTVAGRPAYWGNDPADPEAEAFVVFALSGDHSVELTAFNVTIDDLRRYAADLAPATAEAWVAAHSAAGVK